MIGAFMVTYGVIFFLMGLGEILIPNDKMAITGVIVGLPMIFIGIRRIKYVTSELDNHNKK